MRPHVTTLAKALLLLALAGVVRAECPLDHLIIGCNRDGVFGTEDDHKLFAACVYKYRRSGDTEYANWFYPLRRSIFPSYGYRIGEPGFDAFQGTNPEARHTYDPNRALAGEPDLDYRVIVKCIAVSDGLRAVHKEYPQFTIEGAGESFNHSYLYSLRGDGHMHLSYQALDGENLKWITFEIHDELDDEDRYEPSAPLTIVFNAEPPAGDLVVDGSVDFFDLSALSDYWLAPASSRRNDYCERSDMNRDGVVDVYDLALMARNWRVSAASGNGASGPP